MSISNIKCQNCGTRVMFDTSEGRNCPKCGQPLAMPAATLEAQEEKGSASRRLWVVLLMVGVGLAIIKLAAQSDRNVFTDTQKTFRVTLPEDVTLKDFAYDAPGGSLRAYLWTNWSRERPLLVSMKVFERGPDILADGRTLQQLADDLIVDDMIDPKGEMEIFELVSKQTRTRSGHQVTRALFKAVDGGLEVAREAYVLPPRVYLLEGSCERDVESEPAIKRFFESFEPLGVDQQVEQ